MRLIFSDKTSQMLDRVAANLPHALLLSGPGGVGLESTAKELASRAGAEIQVVLPEKNDKIDIQNGTVTISTVRRLYKLTRGKSRSMRIFAIKKADSMSLEAQNAFLKLLEEPAPNVCFVLLAHRQDKLIATVRSRLQLEVVRPISAEQTVMLVKSLGVTDESKIKQLRFLAEGLPAKLAHLAGDDDFFKKEAELFKSAYEFVRSGSYGRLVVANSLKSDREAAVKVIGYAIDLLMREVAQNKAPKKEIVALLKRLETALRQLEASGNVRLVLSAAAQ